jgi:peptidyl-prolyl cis-trans isomerase B (cyclophilin B)
MSRFFPLSALFLFFSLAAPQAVAASPVKVRMQTNHGAITLELYPDKAPQTVANFLRYVDSKHYENAIFHRVIAGFMIQGGGFDTNYIQKPTLTPIPNEADNGLKNLRGTIAMARTGDPHSATSQFFINHKDNAVLDFTAKDINGWGYCVFGKVVGGMNVVDEIANIPTSPGNGGEKSVPQSLVVIDRVERIKEAPKAMKETKKPAPVKTEPAAVPKETPAKPDPATTTKEAP